MDTTEFNSGTTTSGTALFTVSGNTITVNQTGLYRIDALGPFFAGVVVAATTNCKFQISLNVGGSFIADINDSYTNPTGSAVTQPDIRQFTSITMSLTAADQIYLYAYQNSGNSQSVTLLNAQTYPRIIVTQLI